MITEKDISELLEALNRRLDVKSKLEGNEITFYTNDNMLIDEIRFKNYLTGIRILEAVLHWSHDINKFDKTEGLSDRNKKTLKAQRLRQELTIHEAKAKIKEDGECLIWFGMF